MKSNIIIFYPFSLCIQKLRAIKNFWGRPRGVMVKSLDYGIIVSEFELQLHYYVHFWTNTLGKGMNPLTLPAMG